MCVSGYGCGACSSCSERADILATPLMELPNIYICIAAVQRSLRVQRHWRSDEFAWLLFVHESVSAPTDTSVQKFGRFIRFRCHSRTLRPRDTVTRAPQVLLTKANKMRMVYLCFNQFFEKSNLMSWFHIQTHTSAIVFCVTYTCRQSEAGARSKRSGDRFWFGKCV